MKHFCYLWEIGFRRVVAHEVMYHQFWGSAFLMVLCRAIPVRTDGPMNRFCEPLIVPGLGRFSACSLESPDFSTATAIRVVHFIIPENSCRFDGFTERWEGWVWWLSKIFHFSSRKRTASNPSMWLISRIVSREYMDWFPNYWMAWIWHILFSNNTRRQ